MKSTGIIRQVDELGRIVIPKEIRKSKGISPEDPIEIYVEGDRIILEKYQNACTFCGTTLAELKSYKGKMICTDCIKALLDA